MISNWQRNRPGCANEKVAEGGLILFIQKWRR